MGVADLGIVTTGAEIGTGGFGCPTSDGALTLSLVDAVDCVIAGTTGTRTCFGGTTVTTGSVGAEGVTTSFGVPCICRGAGALAKGTTVEETGSTATCTLLNGTVD